MNKTKTSECSTCGAEISLTIGTISGELIDCSDCGTELEVTNVAPFTLQEAPQEEEDWGE